MNNPDERRDRKRWAVAGVILLLLAAGAALIFATNQPGSGRPSSPGAGRKPASPPVTGPGPAQPQQGCRTAPPSDVVPTAPPRDVAWRNVGAVLVPTSASEGPTRHAGAIWSCYAHSPMGAVLASYGILATLTGPGWRAVAEREIVPGPGQRAFITAGEHQKYQPPQPGSVSQPVGFQVVSYTPQQATIEALADGGGQYVVIEQTVAWSGSDWRLVVAPDGRTGPDPQSVSGSTGFVLWGGGHA